MTSFSQFHLRTHDVAAARGFYERVLGDRALRWLRQNRLRWQTQSTTCWSLMRRIYLRRKPPTHLSLIAERQKQIPILQFVLLLVVVAVHARAEEMADKPLPIRAFLKRAQLWRLGKAIEGG